MSNQAGVPPRILVVEDEAVVQLALTEALRDLGFSVEPVGTAGAALERLHELGGAIDAAIVDIGLPDRSGDTLTVELRQRHVGLPIIIATGSIDPDLR
ncbi:MAG TPA: response regulator, partial [Vineibacter sp.]|nr:response regulator [Vineibacter sp.]